MTSAHYTALPPATLALTARTRPGSRPTDARPGRTEPRTDAADVRPESGAAR